MAYILQLETSTDVCSVAIGHNGSTVCLLESQRPNSHTEQLTVLIMDCLTQTGISPGELSAVALSDGPGSYTSLRVGAATAKGLCFACNIPLITISSLQILMHGVKSDALKAGDLVIAMIDARREEVYGSVFNRERMELMPPRSIILDEDDMTTYRSDHVTWHMCGNGTIKFRAYERGQKCMYHHTTASAEYMTGAAWEAYNNAIFKQVDTFSPDYIKMPHITSSRKKIL